MSQHEANEIAQETQRMWRARRALKLGLPTVAALGAGAAIAVAAIPGSDGVITGCYANKFNEDTPENVQVYGNAIEPPGALRVIDPNGAKLPTGGSDPARECVPGESTITWNQSGPTGPQGTIGTPGVPGAQGPAGSGGSQGPAGTPGAQELLPAVQFGFDNRAGKMFLKLDGVQGESSDGKQGGVIEISSFSFGAGNGGAQAGGSGGGAGKTSLSSFTITKTLDKSSSLLQKAALDGQHYKEADVFFARKAGGTQQNYLELKLDNVMISSYQAGGAGGGGGSVPTETIQLQGSNGQATFISGNKQSNVNLKFQPGA
jgi:type VI secretion system secreted protein Hcp